MSCGLGREHLCTMLNSPQVNGTLRTGPEREVTLKDQVLQVNALTRITQLLITTFFLFPRRTELCKQDAMCCDSHTKKKKAAMSGADARAPGVSPLLLHLGDQGLFAQHGAAFLLCPCLSTEGRKQPSPAEKGFVSGAEMASLESQSRF